MHFSLFLKLFKRYFGPTLSKCIYTSDMQELNYTATILFQNSLGCFEL
jgi:hypothetical protein